MNNVLILTYWSYKDALIQTYTLPYVKIIRGIVPKNYRIFLYTFESNEYKMSLKEWEWESNQLKKEGITLKRSAYKNFGVFAIIFNIITLLRIIFLIYGKNIKVIHAFCMPAGSLAWILKKFTPVKIIIDSFEPHAETMVEAGQWDKRSFRFRLLFYFEKKITKSAFAVIACVDKMKDYCQEKYHFIPKNFYWKPVAIDFEHFSEYKIKNEELLNELNLSNKIIGVYAGKFGGSYLKKEVFEFIKECYIIWGDSFRFLLLSNHPSREIDIWMNQLEIPNSVLIKKFISHSLIPDYIGLADFGLVPFVPVPSKRYGSPIKTAEYMALGIPIIITKNISDDSALIENNNIGYVLNDLTIYEYRKAIHQIIEIKKDSNLTKKIINIAKLEKNFIYAFKAYNQLYK